MMRSPSSPRQSCFPNRRSANSKGLEMARAAASIFLRFNAPIRWRACPVAVMPVRSSRPWTCCRYRRPPAYHFGKILVLPLCSIRAWVNSRWMSVAVSWPWQLTRATVMWSMPVRRWGAFGRVPMAVTVGHHSPTSSPRWPLVPSPSTRKTPTLSMLARVNPPWGWIITMGLVCSNQPMVVKVGRCSVQMSLVGLGSLKS